MSNRKRYNPELRTWKGKSYKKNGKPIPEVRTESEVYGDDDGLYGLERGVEYEEI